MPTAFEAVSTDLPPRFSLRLGAYEHPGWRWEVRLDGDLVRSGHHSSLNDAVREAEAAAWDVAEGIRLAPKPEEPG